MPGERLDLSRIAELTITATNGVAVPVAQVAHVVWASEEPILWRRNRDMAITVRADVRGIGRLVFGFGSQGQAVMGIAFRSPYTGAN
jgi:multidrug efflux pump subunit AcrB